METFEVKRGLVKSIGGNAGLAKLATTYFEMVEASAEGHFTGSFAIMKKVTGHYNEDGKLIVDVDQMKGGELGDFLGTDEGKSLAMESRKRWSGFLDEATGYNPKQRGDKAKEAGKKISKSKSMISMARKLMTMSDKYDDETRANAESQIEEIEKKLAEGNGTRAFSLAEKLNKYLEG